MRRPVLRCAWLAAVSVVVASIVARLPASASAQSLELVSVADDGTPADGPCFWPSMSDDGNRVVFASLATNLVAGDTNGKWDVFLCDRADGTARRTTHRVSVSSSGAEGDGESLFARISADGRIVVFASNATNLVDGDTNARWDVFVYDVDTATTTRISVDDAGDEGDGDSFDPFPSADGRYVFFDSASDDLVPGDLNFSSDVFVRDLASATTTRVSLTSAGEEVQGSSFVPACSRDARFVSFLAEASNLDPLDSDSFIDVYLRDLVAGTTTLVSLNSRGEKADGHTWYVLAPVSDDGHLVAFESLADNLFDGDQNLVADVFVRDLAATTTFAAGVDSDGDFPTQYPGGSSAPSMSGDGRFVTFESVSDFFDPKDESSQILDVFCRDRVTPLTTRQSLAPDGGGGNYHSREGAINHDGSLLVFSSEASNLLDGNPVGGDQIYLRTRRLDPAYWQSYGAGVPGTHGIPSLTLDVDPVLHHDVALQIDNSSGTWSVALLLLGDAAVQWPTSFGGDLLVDPSLSILLSLPPGGQKFGGVVPTDESLVGLVLYAQVLEIDAGAGDGISFTPGVELGVGY